MARRTARGRGAVNRTVDGCCRQLWTWKPRDHLPLRRVPSCRSRSSSSKCHVEVPLNGRSAGNRLRASWAMTLRRPSRPLRHARSHRPPRGRHGSGFGAGAALPTRSQPPASAAAARDEHHHLRRSAPPPAPGHAHPQTPNHRRCGDHGEAGLPAEERGCSSSAIAQVRWPPRRAVADCCFQRGCLPPTGTQLSDPPGPPVRERRIDVAKGGKVSMPANSRPYGKDPAYSRNHGKSSGKAWRADGRPSSTMTRVRTGSLAAGASAILGECPRTRTT
jgi:hypothetical protein